MSLVCLNLMFYALVRRLIMLVGVKFEELQTARSEAIQSKFTTCYINYAIHSIKLYLLITSTTNLSSDCKRQTRQE